MEGKQKDWKKFKEAMKQKRTGKKEERLKIVRKHFLSKEEIEQGPSCSNLKQIADMKLIHIRFTHNNGHICEHEVVLVKAPNMRWFLAFHCPSASKT